MHKVFHNSILCLPRCEWSDQIGNKHAASQESNTANWHTYVTHTVTHTHMQVQVCGASQCDLVRFVIGDSSCIKLSRCLTGNNCESVSASVPTTSPHPASGYNYYYETRVSIWHFVCMQISCIRFRQLTDRVARLGKSRRMGLELEMCTPRRVFDRLWV